eukprot:2811927-Rhodomonas_salina.1
MRVLHLTPLSPDHLIRSTSCALALGSTLGRALCSRSYSAGNLSGEAHHTIRTKRSDGAAIASGWHLSGGAQAKAKARANLGRSGKRMLRRSSGSLALRVAG